jgi:hypothetical protein
MPAIPTPLEIKRAMCIGRFAKWLALTHHFA